MATVNDTSALEKSFAQAETSRKDYNLKRKHWIMSTLWDELKIIKQALQSDWVSKTSLIAHLIPNIPDADCDGDSSLDAAAGWSVSMGFWWYHPWPDENRNKTLRVIKDGKSGELISINALECVIEILNYAACTHSGIHKTTVQK